MLTEKQPSAVSYRLSARLIRSLPDLLLGLLFAAAWLNLFNLGARHGVSLMVLVEIEGWIIIVTFMSAALAYALTKDTEWTERAKDVIGLVLFCTLPPIYFAVRWHVWWPIPTYALLLWNRFRLAPWAKRERASCGSRCEKWSRTRPPGSPAFGSRFRCSARGQWSFELPPIPDGAMHRKC